MRPEVTPDGADATADGGRRPASIEVVVGVVGRAHGLAGEAVVEVRTDEPERRFAPGLELRAEGTDRRFTVASRRDHSGRLLVRFAGVDDRTAAEALRGVRLVTDVAPDERPAEPEEFYDRQLVGLTVLDATGSRVGRVSGVAHLPAQDLLAVETPGGERLVPFVVALVPVVDLAAGVLHLAEVPGLLADEPES